MPETLNGRSVQRFIGNNCVSTLILGDCMDLFNGIKCDAVITDPPYGVTACKWDVRPDTQKLWELIRLTCASKTVMIATEPFATDLINSNRKNFRWDDVWVKPPCGMLMKDRPLRAHERILIFGTGVYNPIKTSACELLRKLGTVKKLNGNSDAKVYGQKEWIRDTWTETGERCAKSVVYFSRPKNNQHTKTNQNHPTEKPVGLMQYIIEMHTDSGNTILDPFMGSGSTGVACARAGRNFIGIERDAKYHKIACDRIAHEFDGTLL